MRRVVILVTALTVIMSVALRSGHGEMLRKEARAEPKKDEKISRLMHAKLEHSQKVLEGIALNDFDMIAKQADELILLSQKAEWMVLRTPKYEMYSNEFRRSAENLIRNAKDKNVDAAALSYVELTLSCVRCHKYVREVRQARLD